MALSIELAAARAPSLGLDGLLSALELEPADPLRRQPCRRSPPVTSRGDRLELRPARQRCAADPAGSRGVRRSVRSRCRVRRGGPASETVVLGALASLVDWNLISLRSGRPDRYGVLETIRQYAFEPRRVRRREQPVLRARHGEWCRAKLADLLERAPGDDAWCAEVDALVDRGAGGTGHLTGGHLEATPGDAAPMTRPRLRPSPGCWPTSPSSGVVRERRNGGTRTRRR